MNGNRSLVCMKRIIVFLVGTVAMAQTLVNATYDDPTVIRVAPGQVIPLLVTGLKTVLPQGGIQAQVVPLPITLAGISVSLQSSVLTATAARMLPLFSIEQFNHCTTSLAPAPDCFVTAITVQFPFDVPVASPFQTTPMVITILENGTASRAFSVYVTPDNIHILKSCDIGGQTRGTGVCYPLVTHLDGRLVLQAPRATPDGPPLTNSEAVPGETLVMYAYGLGQVTPAVTAGTVSPNTPATATEQFEMRYDYLPNLSPSLPSVPFGALPIAPPPFVGLTPGQVGLYQINFVVPTVIAEIASCGQNIQSNFTVSITGHQGTFDGAAICVTPPAQIGLAGQSVKR